MNINDFDYDLPASYIAQSPAEPRDSSRLMIVNRAQQTVTHRIFRDVVEYLSPGDVLVINNTRVIPARIPAVRADTGGKLEILLLRQQDDRTWLTLIGGKRGDVGMPIAFEKTDLTGEIIEVLADAERVVQFNQPIQPYLDQLGEMPLPPYIHTRLEDTERYQTIYSRYEGSAAAPTAGLHFTPELMLKLRDQGVKFAYCTLHIGLDTFQPVRVENIQDHKIHSEWAKLDADNARIINEAKLAGKQIVAVGTTSARTLETAGILSAGGDPGQPEKVDGMCAWRPVIAFERNTNLFIYPGYNWRVVSGLITNFHLPKSTLLMMISSLMGREFTLSVYETAKAEQYRFFSFGDAMFIR
jgi:S-adenosylmethionine:tRNA ribosyltransferase-isomerase